MRFLLDNVFYAEIESLAVADASPCFAKKTACGLTGNRKSLPTKYTLITEVRIRCVGARITEGKVRCVDTTIPDGKGTWQSQCAEVTL